MSRELTAAERNELPEFIGDRLARAGWSIKQSSEPQVVQLSEGANYRVHGIVTVHRIEWTAPNGIDSVTIEYKGYLSDCDSLSVFLFCSTPDADAGCVDRAHGILGMIPHTVFDRSVLALYLENLIRDSRDSAETPPSAHPSDWSHLN